MLNRTTRGLQKEKQNPALVLQNKSKNYQHETHTDGFLLLHIPPETLTAITTYLDPPSLLSLGRVNGVLNEHVKKDNTWHRAFVCYFLGVGPESDLTGGIRSLMLRRSESSWRKEFIVRYELRKRWEKSRNPTVTHVPVPAPIASMHIMPGPSLLTSVVQYGIVARSFPFTGKVLQGYLYASGARTGFGIGNPNAEFSPNVSVCALSSSGGTARVLWGFRNGEVAVTTAGRAMDSNRRSNTDFMKCSVGDQHDRAISDAVWSEGSALNVVTASLDGRVKLWDAKSIRCLWTSKTKPGTLVPDACIKVAAALSCGVITTVMQSGEVAIWVGDIQQSTDGLTYSPAKETRIPYVSLPATPNGAEESVGSVSRNAETLHVDHTAPVPTILVHFFNEPCFFKHSVNPEGENTTITTTFGDLSFGPISSLFPVFSAESSFVITGDSLGCVSVYDWNASLLPSRSSVLPVRRFEAYEDGSTVTAIAWNDLTLITGTSRGCIDVWDGLDFEHLRSFSVGATRFPAHLGFPRDPRENVAISDIKLGSEKDVMVISAGDRILAWKAARKNSSGGVRGRHSPGNPVRKKEKRALTKYMKHLEMTQTISESRLLLEQESESTRWANGRAREHMRTLDNLGLSEAEAIDYVLMLSRDEAAANGDTLDTNDSTGLTDDGVFEADIDDVPPRRLDSRSIISTEIHSSPSVSTSSSSSSADDDNRLTGSAVHSRAVETSSDAIHFPPIGSSVGPSSALSSSSLSSLSSMPNSLGSDSHGPRPEAEASRTPVMVGRPQSRRSTSPRSSAWSTPLMKSVSRSPQSSSSPGSVRAHIDRPIPPRRSPSAFDDVDSDLRFALELSLAEARSRGENV